MKKKLSIIGAAILAVSSIAITSAHASPLVVTVNGVANVTTSNVPQAVAVPATNVIDAGHTVAITATADTATAVNFTASSNVKLVSTLSTVQVPVTTSNGTGSATGPNWGTSCGAALEIATLGLKRSCMDPGVYPGAYSF
jgi:hypothetical protein